MKASLSVVCSISKLRSIRSFVAKSIKGIDLPELQRQEVVLAVDEICANAIIHGNNSNENKKIHIDVTIAKNTIKIEVYDIGREDFEKLVVKKKNINDIIKSRQKGGMGLKLVHKIMDKVGYVKKGGVHKCILIKNIH